MSPDIDELVGNINAIDRSTIGGDAEGRTKLMLAAQSLMTRLATPWDFIQKVTWQEVCEARPHHTHSVISIASVENMSAHDV